MSKRKASSGVEPRKEPKQERSRQTYQVILQGAATLIRRDGIQKFSTNKVAEESGVSIGSLYQYFPSKEAIIAALIDQVFEVEYGRMKEKLDGLDPKMGARKILKEMLAQYFNIDGEVLTYRRVLTDLVAMVDKTNEALRFHRSMGELILDYFHLQFKTQLTAVDRETVLFMLTYMLRATALSSVDPGIQKVDKEALVSEVAEMWIHLLRVPEAYRDAFA
jgi:AcrR family transcriptional regulator